MDRSTEVRTLVFRKGLTFLGLAVLSVITLIEPSLSPFWFFQFWTIQGSLLEAIWSAWPLYLFMIGLNAWSLFRKYDGYKDTLRDIFQMGFAVSAWAGFVEEVFFRWLCFFGAMILMPLINWFLWYLTGVEIIRNFYVGVVLPLANFFTLHYLQDVLMDGYGWIVGAAIITANGQFRNGHAYQGLFGFTLSWFFGMYMFWIMFHFGLPAAILIHFLTDLCVFMTVWVDAFFEKRNGG